jgi:hypothetical protein
MSCLYRHTRHTHPIMPYHLVLQNNLGTHSNLLFRFLSWWAWAIAYCSGFRDNPHAAHTPVEHVLRERKSRLVHGSFRKSPRASGPTPPLRSRGNHSSRRIPHNCPAEARCVEFRHIRHMLSCSRHTSHRNQQALPTSRVCFSQALDEFG